MGWFGAFFSTEMQKRSLKAALMMISRKRMEQPSCLSQELMCGATKKPKCPTHPDPDDPAGFLSQCLCIISLSGLALGCP